MARTQHQTEYIAMIETGNESQPIAQWLFLRNDATVVGCTDLLFQPSFFLCCLRNMRRSTRWLRYGVGDQSTLRITRPDTAQSERAPVRLTDTSFLQAVCIMPKERVAHVIHVLTASHLVLSCSCCEHTTTRELRAFFRFFCVCVFFFQVFCFFPDFSGIFQFLRHANDAEELERHGLFKKSKTHVANLNAFNHEPVFGITSISDRQETLHDDHIIAVREEPNYTLTPTSEMSQM